MVLLLNRLIILSERGPDRSKARLSNPEYLSEVTLSLSPHLVLLGVYVQEIASLAVSATRLIGIRQTFLSLVLVISLLVLAKFLHTMSKLALIVILTISSL